MADLIYLVSMGIILSWLVKFQYKCRVIHINVIQFACTVPAERVVEVLRLLGTSVGPYGLAGGQVMDLECENREGVTLQDLEWIHMHKTACLLKVRNDCLGPLKWL